MHVMGYDGIYGFPGLEDEIKLKYSHYIVFSIINDVAYIRRIDMFTRDMYCVYIYIYCR